MTELIPEPPVQRVWPSRIKLAAVETLSHTPSMGIGSGPVLSACFRIIEFLGKENTRMSQPNPDS